jgi:hypothetical protein
MWRAATRSGRSLFACLCVVRLVVCLFGCLFVWVGGSFIGLVAWLVGFLFVCLCWAAALGRLCVCVFVHSPVRVCLFVCSQLASQNATLADEIDHLRRTLAALDGA